MLCFKHIYLIYNSIFSKGLLCLFLPVCCLRIFCDLVKEIDSICKAGADYLHIDVMDGHFVPNLTFGLPVVSQVAKRSSLPLDVHLMVERVEWFVEYFLPLRPEFISVHIEAVAHLHRLITHIRANGVRPAVVLNPHTSERACAIFCQMWIWCF